MASALGPQPVRLRRSNTFLLCHRVTCLSAQRLPRWRSSAPCQSRGPTWTLCRADPLPALLRQIGPVILTVLLSLADQALSSLCSSLHQKRATAVEYPRCRCPELNLEGNVVEQFDCLSKAHFAMEHVGRLKQLVRHRPCGRPLQRHVRALEEAAIRMELEARALSVRHWRAMGHAWWPGGA